MSGKGSHFVAEALRKKKVFSLRITLVCLAYLRFPHKKKLPKGKENNDGNEYLKVEKILPFLSFLLDQCSKTCIRRNTKYMRILRT